MQDYFRSSEVFSQRTDALAAKLGVFLKDLPEIIGISERMLFGYRSGRHPLTAKALRKLETAEREAGISHPPPERTGDTTNYANPKDLDADKFAAALAPFAEAQRALIARMGHLDPQPQDILDEIRETAKRIGRWPLPAEDQKKPPWVVLMEYREIEASQKTSSKALGDSG